MTCSEVQASLADLLYEELDAEARGQILAHLEGCGACGEAWSRLRTLSAAADQWTAPALPRGIAERALARVARDRARERSGAWPHLSPEDILRCVGLGAVAALVSLVLVVGISQREVAPLVIGALGVLWTALYAGLFLTASHAKLRPVAWAALTGAGIAFILVPPLSIPSVVEACARLVRAAPESVPFALLVVVVAAGYTAGPLLVGGLAFGRAGRGARVADGATLSILYALLIAPAVYLQCLSLPLNVVAIWMAGVVLGVGVTGPLSLRLAGWRATPA
jgi:hypothetical protein